VKLSRFNTSTQIFNMELMKNEKPGLNPQRRKLQLTMLNDLNKLEHKYNMSKIISWCCVNGLQ